MENPHINQTVTAKQLQEWLLEDTDLPFRMKNTAVDGELNLRFTRIRRPIDIDECEFSGKVDVRNARFQATVSLTKCHFKEHFNSGDREFSNTIYNEDMVFNDCTFDNRAWFTGVQCEGSGSFHGVLFKSELLPDEENDPYTVDFYAAKFGKALEMTSTSFSGAANFNALKCGMGAFFHDAKFELDDFRWPVNFIASSFGVACELMRATFRGAAIFEGMSCGYALNLELSNFTHNLFLTNFIFISTPNLVARGARFRGPTHFGSMRSHFAFFDPYIRYTNVYAANALRRGPVSSDLRDAFKENNIPLADNAEIVQQNNIWQIPSGDGLNYVLRVENDQVVIVAPTTFERSADFSNSQVEWVLNLKGALFEGPTTFNGSRCGGSGLFENSRFNSPEMVDFKFSSFGVNLELVDTEAQGQLALESCSIKSDLQLSGAKLHSGIDLTNASMQRLEFKRRFPLRRKRSVFRGCRFDILDAPLFSKRKWKSWEFLVHAQDPSNFTRDLYHMLERYYRSDGQASEADDIYQAGRRAERKLAWKRKSGVDWPPRKWVTDSLSKWLTGYGVSPFKHLLGWIIGFAVVGVIVFWSDDALIAVKPSESNIVVAEEGVLIDRSNREEAEAPPNSTSSSPPTINVLRKVAGRFAYSLDELLPVVDLHIADQWRPATALRRAYLAVHILFGWLLIPLLIGAFTGMLTKN